MANNCYFEMKIKGTKANCEAWYKKMTSCDELNHFYRIFSADIYNEGGTDKEYYMCIAGDCAWSLETCCRASGYSEGTDLFAVNTQGLNLVMEAYSSEPGCAFQEHYIYNRGNCLKDACVDYYEVHYNADDYYDFEAFKREYDIPDEVTEDDLDEGGNYCEGGFKDWIFTI